MEKNKQFFVNWFTYYMLIKLGINFSIFYYFKIYYLVLFFSILIFVTLVIIFFINNYKDRIRLEELITYTSLPFVISAVIFGNIVFENNISSYYSIAMLLIFISVFNNKKVYFRIIGLTLFSVVIAFLVTRYFSASHFMREELSKLGMNEMIAFNFLEIFFQIIACVFISYNIFLYIQYLKENAANAVDGTQNDEITEVFASPDKQFQENEKFDLLYQKIIKVLEEEKPYLNPDFKITDLSKLIGSNRSYTSNALNRSGKNFNSLINHYRVEDAKKELMKGRKIMDVYYEVGFKYLNTFSKAFAETEGIVPEKFLSNIKAES